MLVGWVNITLDQTFKNIYIKFGFWVIRIWPLNYTTMDEKTIFNEKFTNVYNAKE